jgi:hypothetical protein
MLNMALRWRFFFETFSRLSARRWQARPSKWESAIPRHGMPTRAEGGAPSRCARCATAISRRHASEFGWKVVRPEIRGRGECRAPMHPQPRVQCRKHTSVVTTSSPVKPGIPARNGFTAYFVLSPVIGLFCHRHLARLHARLDAGVEASGPHDFAVRVRRSRLEHRPRPPHPDPR